ncbi:MAG: 4'-phosphopantetheinyl transferase superfamily protein [Solirubrobacterales bacterium]|nr:4'-phosphopantetheinyl transferase superfamily protein [Solirubrobacterales bacterium]
MIAAGPAVRLLDARQGGLDESGLRGWARSLSDAHPDLTASRSYRYPYALVAWHDGPVGVDIERVEACGASFLESISTPAERSVEAPPERDPDAHAISLWCGKEALSKALGDALEYDPRRLESPLGWPDGRCGPWHAESLSAPDGYVAWVCWR